MTILELTLLRVLPASTTSSTPTQEQLLSTLSQVRTSLSSAGYPTHSRFYRSLTHPSEIYILGLWESVAQHREFLESPQCAEILAPQEGVMGWVWGVHLAFNGDGGDGGVEEGGREGGGRGGRAREMEGWGDEVGILRMKRGSEAVEVLRRSCVEEMGDREVEVLLSSLSIGLDGEEKGEEVVIFRAGKKGNGNQEVWLKCEEKMMKQEEVIDARVVRNMESGTG